jgi:glycosyltransferase involved in cell wall biosynthesis
MFVHASNKEGEANVVNEAMACGIPCLVPNTGPYDTQVPISCAYRFLSGNVKDLSNGMKTLISDEALRISVGRSAANHITLTRSPDKAAAYYADLLRRIIDLPPL